MALRMSIFLRRSATEHIAVVEVGVQNGGSLELWDEYFFRANAIVGCDIWGCVSTTREIVGFSGG